MTITTESQLGNSQQVSGPVAGTMVTIPGNLGYARISSPTQTAVAAGNYSFDCSAQHIFLKTGGSGTFTIANMTEGQTVNIVVTSTGSAYAITWSPTVIWPSNGKPTPTVVSGVYDFYTLIKIGGSIFGAAMLGMLAAA